VELKNENAIIRFSFFSILIGIMKKFINSDDFHYLY